MISGAAGALAVVQADMTSNTGPLKDLPIEERVENVFMSVIVLGAMQFAFGVLGLSRFFTLIPNTSLIGFLNGLAIIIFLAQLPTFKKCTTEIITKFEICNQLDQTRWLTFEEGEFWMVLLIVLMTIGIMFFFPKVPKIGKHIPASLVAVIMSTIFEFGINRPFIGYDTRTVEDTAPIAAKFPTPQLPNLGPNANWSIIIQFSVSLAAIGIFESFLTLQAVNEIVKNHVTRRAADMETVALIISSVAGFKPWEPTQ